MPRSLNDETLAGAVLLVIDMQKAFDGPPWPRRWNQAVDRNGLLLLDRWRTLGWPIFHVRHDSVEPGSTLAAGTPGNAFRNGFAPRDHEPLIVKSVNAAFIGTDLDLRLRRIGATTIVVFGISTDMCVSTSTRVGSNLGYRMIVAADACDCFDLAGLDGEIIAAKRVHDTHLATLAHEFAAVAPTQDILDRSADAARG